MDRNKTIIKYSFLGISVNIVLVILKTTVGLITNSIAVILDAINNLGDSLSSIVVIIGTKLSSKPADKEHPFGHGRIEYFASVIVAIIILLAGLDAIKESITKIINPTTPNYSFLSLVIITITILVKIFYGNYIQKVGKQVNSSSLIAAGTDAFMDSILSLSVLIAAIISILFNINLEAYLGVIISIIIIKTDYTILKETINSILGERTDTELITKLRDKINSYKEVEGTYDIILHNYGPTNHIGSAHIQIRNDMHASHIHKLTRQITSDIYNEFGIILTIGIYASNDNGRYASIKKELNKIIKKYKEVIQLHGFYVDSSHKTISFDLIIDYECQNPNEIKDIIIKEIKEKYPKYEYFVIIDRDFSD